MRATDYEPTMSALIMRLIVGLIVGLIVFFLIKNAGYTPLTPDWD